MQFNRMNIHRPKCREFFLLSEKGRASLELKQVLWAMEEKLQKIDDKFLGMVLSQSKNNNTKDKNKDAHRYYRIK
ncbi:MAG: hypothetical protein NC898_04005 [Candidatus Omnitrophica bacterium]|nr:hypothetical protein [Candidatus Omnitrophota bacterium]MCM8793612.1 hypothetical protein [Candidatus Omnitrophota bacterium]